MTIIDEIQAKTDRPVSKRLLERVKGYHLESNKYERKIELEGTYECAVKEMPADYALFGGVSELKSLS
jgi:hypothetical protein